MGGDCDRAVFVEARERDSFWEAQRDHTGYRNRQLCLEVISRKLKPFDLFQILLDNVLQRQVMVTISLGKNYMHHTCKDALVTHPLARYFPIDTGKPQYPVPVQSGILSRADRYCHARTEYEG